MKTSAIAVISLILGLLIGLFFVRLGVNRIVHEQLKETLQEYPPGYVTTVLSMIDVMKGMTTNEVRETINLINTCAQHMRNEVRIKDYYNGFLALSLQQLIDKGDTNKVQDVLSETIHTFAQHVDAGDYKGTTLEEAAKAMVQRWRNQTNLPTTGRTVPPSAGASGVQ